MVGIIVVVVVTDYDFTAVPGRENWSLEDWVVGEFDNIDALIATNLDPVKLTAPTKKRKKQ